MRLYLSALRGYVGFRMQCSDVTHPRPLSRGEVWDGAFFLVVSGLSGEFSPLERGLRGVLRWEAQLGRDYFAAIWWGWILLSFWVMRGWVAVSPLERRFKEKTINNTKTKNVCANFERTLRKRYIFVFMIESQSEFSSEKINISGFYRFFSLFSCSYTLRSSYRNKKYLGKGLAKKWLCGI